MSKHWPQRTGKTPFGVPLVFLVLLLGLAFPPGGAGQVPAMGALRNAKKMQETVQKKDVAPTEKPSTGTSKPQGESETALTATSGRRDPFKFPPPPGKGGAEGVPEGAGPGGPAGPLPPGVRGLIISQLKLEGTVRQETSNVMIAVVTNETRRAYFLRNNDAVYNGAVSKITPDAIYFKENVLDSNGRVSTQEVIKRMGPAAGEGR